MDPLKRSYHWTPALEQHFLAALAESGSVHLAARAVNMSPQSARARKRRDPEGAFARGWNDALAMAREIHFDVMLGAALNAVDYVRVRNSRTGRAGWRCVDPQLGAGKGMALLNRLDKQLGTAGKANTVETSADFGAFSRTSFSR